MEVDKIEYIKWYNIAQKHLQDEIVPKLSDDDIKTNISRENWLMFVKATHDDKKNAVNYPEPNMYLIVERNKLCIGLTFNNAPAVDKFKNIIHKNSTSDKEKIVAKLLALDNRYLTIVLRKIREFRGPTPTYKEELSVQTNKLDDTKFNRIVDLCIKIREEGKEHHKTAKHQSYYEGPTVDLAYVEIEKDEELFKNVLNEIIPIFKLCIGIKNEKEIEDIDLVDKIKKIDSWEWYLEEDRKGLSELLKDKFCIEISPTKLKKIKDKMMGEKKEK